MAGLKDIAWVLDLDGVVWLADEPIPGSAGAIEMLDAEHHQVLFVTNFSALTCRQAELKLEACGIEAKGRVLTSAMAAASLVEPGEQVVVCGGEGIFEAVRNRGATPLDPLQDHFLTSSVDAVIVGFHREFNFDRLAASAQALHNGARLISTNHDPTYPTPEGLLPGNGSLTAAVAVAGKTEPTIAGKPHAPIANLVLERLGVQRGTPQNIVVGDLPATDGLLAAELDFQFGLVLSGVTAADQLDLCEPKPDLVAPNLEAMVEAVLASA